MEQPIPETPGEPNPETPAAEPSGTFEKPGELAEPTEIEQLKKALDEAKAQSDRNLANWQRAQADYLNLQRHSEEERQENAKYAGKEIVMRLLPVIDDFERALKMAPPAMDKSCLAGFEMIERKLLGNLEALGLRPIKSVGELFNPHVHEAVKQDKGKEGIILEEVQKGYTWHDRVIRPAMVIVGNGEE